MDTQVRARKPRTRHLPPAPLVVVLHPLLGGKALVSSRSEPGAWHVIDEGGECDCTASGFGRLCSHERALALHLANRHEGGSR